jgi:hypothetical protein
VQTWNESAAIYFDKSCPPKFELETSDYDTMLTYYVPTNCIQKLKLLRECGHFTYNST